MQVPYFGGKAWAARVQELARVVSAEDLITFQVGPMDRSGARTLVPLGHLRGGKPFGGGDIYCASPCTIAQLREMAGPFVKRGRAGVVTIARAATGEGYQWGVVGVATVAGEAAAAVAMMVRRWTEFDAQDVMYEVQREIGDFVGQEQWRAG